MYDLELDRTADEIKQRKAERVLLQLPEGMKPIAFSLSKQLTEKTGCDVIVSGSSCFGGCDLAIHQAIKAEADLILHYGHSKMTIEETAVPIIYVEARIHLNIPPLIRMLKSEIKQFEVIGITATVQHVHQLEEFANCLRKEGFQIDVGSSSEKTPHKGQVLGCNYDTVNNSSEVDAFLFIGSGLFHPTGLALATKKPVVAFNPYTGLTENIGEKELMNIAKKRMATITKAKEARKIGIVVSIKSGQFNKNALKNIKDDFKEKKVDVLIIYMDEIRPESLENFSEADAYVVTACPRIPIDGLYGFNKPLLTINEAMIVLGKLTWEKLWNTSYFHLPYQSLY